MKQLFAVVECADESGGLPAPIGSIVEIVIGDRFSFDSFILARPEDWLLVKRANGDINGECEFARKYQLKDFFLAG